ncbi:MAG TPA: phosphohistidine phosphatase SixA [Burkholderiaceae bacterium]|nr:phosphohistidine phosphatase SixA [Burkholderiaceae bacterium]
MELILWRHAEAETGEPDLGRKLTAKGEKQARRVAEWLHTRLPQTARIYVSPATRAQQTARALAEISHYKLRTLEDVAPGATAAEVLAAADWPNSKAAIVIVGHQPTLGLVASELLGGQAQDWSIKKGGLWWFSQREQGGEEQTVLRAVINPDLL